jgi:hypothetical protein
MVELYAIKPFVLGAFLAWITTRAVYKINSRPKGFEIKEI